ncbi:Phosphoribulokinase/uridine kinase [Penicillium brevicompactum]|uniref:Phosphoribulokinase/uridine kinase n=1 Tax=Penicillium brevicompactum TaxID=5074 RepID=UPI0025421527|nr:Phosphoribulokinase/uridine kinase [Penicillium brevicompactum]KAJ5322054.1 Phosphoribulokinase/uridine kinase [Penicillium brevicompactum]
MFSRSSIAHQSKQDEMADKAVIIGISGPSSSGKTTLARLLQRIFNGAKTPHSHLNTFIIHEDDFYFPDDKIPYTTTASGERIQDWDTAAAIDLPFLSQALRYVRKNGTLPPRLRSKEDQNDQSDSGIPESTVQELRDLVQSRVSGDRSIAFLEGFLLFAPPRGDHVLREVHDAIQLHVFLPAAYRLVKERREGRSGYVTVGSAPAPVDQGVEVEGGKEEVGEIDMEAEDDRPPQNFWVDPPGYVDDVVWPRYVRDHSWLLIADEGGRDTVEAENDADLVRRIGDGTRVRTDVGVQVAPGAGSAGMDVVLRWAVDLVLGFYLEDRK